MSRIISDVIIVGAGIVGCSAAFHLARSKGLRVLVVENGAEGLLVPSKDEHAIARAVIELLRDPARRAQMSAAGQRKAAQHDWDLIAQRVLAYYDQLIAARDARAASKRSPGKRRMARMRQMLRLPRRQKQSARPSESVP